jgi:histidinol phosphatase-like enzyme (inositol monophosphatase family)
VSEAALAAAVEAARAAGRVALKYYTGGFEIVLKPDATPVTQADRDAERTIVEILGRAFPEHGFLGEEFGGSGNAATRWIIDPIDGTKAFTHGVPLYTNLVALEDDDGIAIGVINMPALAETVYAARGLGCFCNGEPVRVNDRSEVAGSYLTSSGLGPWDDDVLLRARRSGLQMRTWGDGYGYALVATGRVEAMFDPEAALYDLAPMPVILAEAGGRFTDLAGGTSPGGGSGLATNGHLHDELLAILT